MRVQMIAIVSASITLISPFSSFALTATDVAEQTSTEVASRVYNAERAFPTLRRITVLAGGAFKSLDGDPSAYSNTGAMANQGLAGGITLGIGDGLITFESGVFMLGFPTAVSAPDESGTMRSRISRTSYLGVPAWFKLNYSASPMRTFFVKVGAIPIALVGPASVGINGKSVELERTDVLVGGGIGGTAPISDSTSLVLDLSYFTGVIAPYANGSKNEAAMAMVGLCFNL